MDALQFGHNNRAISYINTRKYLSLVQMELIQETCSSQLHSEHSKYAYSQVEKGYYPKP